MCALYRVKIQEWLYKLFSKLDWKKISLWGYIGLASVNCVIVVVPIIVYTVNVASRPIPNAYIANLNNACQK